MEQSPTPILSFFCGAGGLDVGFHQSGFKTILAVDSDSAATTTFARNHPSTPVVRADLSRLSGGDLWRRIEQSEERPRGVIGGPPCQGFSRGNVLAFANDPRNRLPYRFARLLGDLRARTPIDFFVFENVSGLLQPKHAERWERIRSAFEDAGFRLFAQQLNAADFGVPQVRQRVFLVGLDRDRFPDHEFDFPVSRARRRTVADAIRGLPRATYFERGLEAESIPHHPNHWTMQPKSWRFSEKEFCRWRSFRKLAWHEPSPTVAYGNREIHVHPSGRRRLSVLEAMLLQGFPAEYVVCGNFSEQVTQVCNAVPPPVARAIARAVRAQLYAPDPLKRRPGKETIRRCA
jgi:DNA (cytosine-5)-methyltransferase 1